MKSLLCMTLLLCGSIASANDIDSKLSVLLKETKLSCSGSALQLEFPELQANSREKLTSVRHDMVTARECAENLEMVRQALDAIARGNSGLVPVLFKSRTWTHTLYNRDTERCNPIGECHIDYQTWENLTIEASLIGLKFDGTVAMKLLQSDTEHWDERFCPPYAPDCDL